MIRNQHGRGAGVDDADAALEAYILAEDDVSADGKGFALDK
jgi:hypothetical protein